MAVSLHIFLECRFAHCLLLEPLTNVWLALTALRATLRTKEDIWTEFL